MLYSLENIEYQVIDVTGKPLIDMNVNMNIEKVSETSPQHVIVVVCPVRDRINKI